MRYSLLVLLLLLPVTILAQHKNFSVTPLPSWIVPWKPDLEKRADPRDISDGYYLLAYEEQNNAELHATYLHRIRQIESEAGIQNGAEISVAYDPAYERLRFHQIIIRRDGQVINKLQANRFKFLQQEEELSRFIYSGLYTAYFLLEDVRKGDQIDYAYTLEGRNPIFEDKYSDMFYISGGDPIMNFYCNIISSPSRDLHFKSFNNAPLPGSQLLNGMKVYEWKITDMKPLEGKKNVPTWYSSFPLVQVSEYKEWKEIVDWGVSITTQAATGAAVKAKIAALKKEAGDDKALYFKKAVRFVQDDIRYMGIEMGEYSHRPNTPDKILAQRFGDCKDKSLLLATLLNANDIRANMAYLNTYEKQYIEDYLPTPDLFNHAIVCASFNGKDVWIDPTISYQRGDIKSMTIPYYVKALIIAPGNKDFANVSDGQNGRIDITEIFNLPKEKDGKGVFKITSDYTLEFADDLRSSLANASRKDTEKSYREYYKKLYGDLSADGAMEVTDMDSINKLRTNERYILMQPWKTDSSQAGRLTFDVQANILQQVLPAYADASKQESPLALRYPYHLDYSIQLEMPNEWTFKQPDVHIKNSCYKLDFTATAKGSFVRLNYTFQTFQDHIPVKDMDAYIRDRKKIDNILAFNFYWTPGAIADSDSNSEPVSINWLVVGLALFFAAIFGWQAMRLYKTSVYPVRYPLIQLPINGWLVLLSIGTFIRPLLLAAPLIKMKTFQNNFWQQLDSVPNSLGNTSLLQLLLIIELACIICFFVCSLLLVMLFYKRRDHFPKVTIYYLVASVAFTLIDNVAFHFIYNEADYTVSSIASLFGSVAGSVIWVAYLRQSEQVRDTFIMPYDAE